MEAVVQTAIQALKRAIQAGLEVSPRDTRCVCAALA